MCVCVCVCVDSVDVWCVHVVITLATYTHPTFRARGLVLCTPLECRVLSYAAGKTDPYQSGTQPEINKYIKASSIVPALFHLYKGKTTLRQETGGRGGGGGGYGYR